jgi:hypothetical protein
VRQRDIAQRDFVHVVARAHEAELVSRILAALKDLEKDPGEFIRKNLST